MGNLKIVKHFILVFILMSFLGVANSFAQEETADSTKTLTKKEKKAERKRLNKEALKGRHFVVNTNFTYATLETFLELTGPNGVLGAKLSFEDQFGFEKQKMVPSIDVGYSFTRSSSVYLEYYRIHRQSTFNVTDVFDFDDIEIPEGAGEARLYFNTTIWSVGYMYSFINSKKANLSFFVNFFVLSVATGLDVDSQNVSKNLSFTAPLPSFGYKFNYEIVPKLRFGGSHSFFFLAIGDFKGKINNLRLSLDYRILEWLGAGITYTVFDLDIDSEANTLNGHIKYGYQGAGLMLQFIF